ncbi:DNA binding protein [Neoconidiobolus thromboides FSU 785]|nr:DNA binding protein [Neoconidiobolus thromboides FSU 785]
MSEGPSKINANVNYTIGAIKENVGSVLGNHSLEAKGAAQRTEGDAEYKAAQAKGYAEGAKDSFKGNIKDTVGSAIGNEQMQVEGKASKLRGDAKKEINS